MGVFKKVKSILKRENANIEVLELMTLEAPVRSRALYISHQPGKGYRHDRVIIKCDEYKECADRLSALINKLTHLKQDFFNKKSLAGPGDKKYIQKLTEQYINERGPLTEDLKRLERKRRELQNKYAIIGRYNDRIRYHQFLLDELFQIVPRSVFEECSSKATHRFNQLKED